MPLGDLKWRDLNPDKDVLRTLERVNIANASEIAKLASDLGPLLGSEMPRSSGVWEFKAAGSGGLTRGVPFDPATFDPIRGTAGPEPLRWVQQALAELRGVVTLEGAIQSKSTNRLERLLHITRDEVRDQRLVTLLPHDDLARLSPIPDSFLRKQGDDAYRGPVIPTSEPRVTLSLARHFVQEAVASRLNVHLRLIEGHLYLVPAGIIALGWYQFALKLSNQEPVKLCGICGRGFTRDRERRSTKPGMYCSSICVKRAYRARKHALKKKAVPKKKKATRPRR